MMIIKIMHDVSAITTLYVLIYVYDYQLANCNVIKFIYCNYKYMHIKQRYLVTHYGVRMDLVNYCM